MTSRRPALPWAVLACLACLLCLGCEPPATPPATVFGPQARCGDGVVDPTETVETCPEDVCGACHDAACVAKLCSDGLTCTLDTCNAKAGCLHTPASGVPCPDDAPCLVAPTCQGGVCQGPSGLWHVQSMLNKDRDDTLTALAPAPDGGFVAVGWEWQTEQSTFDHADAVFLRFGADGQVLAKTVREGKQHDDRLLGVTPMADGRYLAVGHEAGIPSTFDKTPESRFVWTAFDPDGSGQPGLGEKGHRHALRAVAIDLTGAPLAVGTSEPGGLVVRLAKDAGKALWTAEMMPPQGEGELDGVAASRIQAAAWLAVGRAVHDGQTSGWLQRIGDSDTTAQQAARLVAPKGMHARLIEVVALADGTFIAAGECSADLLSGPPGSRHLYLLRVDAALQSVWEHVGPGGFADAALALSADEQTVVVGGGRAGPGGENGSLLQWFGLDGALRHERWRQGVPAGQIADLPGVRLGHVGCLQVAGQLDAFAERVDAWGHRACLDAGACVDQPAGACDDGDPCTLDDCTGASGCSHVPAPAGSACALGKACDAGACK